MLQFHCVWQTQGKTTGNLPIPETGNVE